MTDPVFAGLAAGLEPEDTLVGTLADIRDSLQNIDSHGERIASAFETLVALLASVTGTANAECAGPTGPSHYEGVNYIRAGAASEHFPCDQDAAPKRGRRRG